MKPTLKQTCPEINDNQAKLLLRELISVLPDMKSTDLMEHDDFYYHQKGFNHCLSQVRAALTEYCGGSDE